MLQLIELKLFLTTLVFIYISASNFKYMLLLMTICFISIFLTCEVSSNKSYGVNI